MRSAPRPPRSELYQIHHNVLFPGKVVYMNAASNPFTPSFGSRPPFLVGRDGTLDFANDRIREAAESTKQKLDALTKGSK